MSYDEYFLRIIDGEIVYRCQRGDKQLPKSLGAAWNRNCWHMPFTVENVSALLDGPDYVLVEPDLEDKLVAQIELEEKLECIVRNAKKNKPIKLRIPGIKGSGERLYNYQRWGVLFAVTNGTGVLIADEMGLGKCSVSESSVMSEMGRRTIGDVFERDFQTKPLKVESDGGEWYALKSGRSLRLISSIVDRVVWQSVKSIYREKASTIRRVMLQDGSYTDVGLRHGFWTLDGWKRAADLVEGEDWVRVAARIDVPVPEDVDVGLARFLAWQIAEGHEPRSSGNTLTITQKDRRILDDLHEWFLSAGFDYTDVSGVRTDRSVHVLYLCSRKYKMKVESEFPDYRWGERSANKVVPLRIQNARMDVVREFLRAYWDAEGCCNEDNLELSSKSRKVVDAVHFMLRRFGVLGLISPKVVETRKGVQEYWRLTIGGQFARVFRQAIGFGDAEKTRKLDQLCGRIANANVGLSVPCRSLLCELKDLTGLSFRALGMCSRVYMSDAVEPQNPSRDVVFRIVQTVRGYLRDGLSSLKGRWAARRENSRTALSVHGDRIGALLTKLEMLASPDFFWLQVSSTEDRQWDGWLYDFEMYGEPNYLTDLMVTHNTIQALATACYMKYECGSEHCLIVTPASLKWNWPVEIEKFTDESYVVIDAKGDPDKRVGQWLTDDVFFYIVNYELLLEDLFGGKERVIHKDDDEATIEKKVEMIEKAEERAKLLKPVRERVWDMMICDEIHAIRSHKAKRTKNVKRIKSKFRIGLTGTPMDGRLEDLHSVMDWVVPRLLGTKTAFLERHAVFDYFGRPIRYKGLKRVKKKIGFFFLRRLKKKVLPDLPDKVYQTRQIILSPKEMEIYGEIKEGLYDADVDEESEAAALTAVLRCKQFCDHPEILDFDLPLASKMEVFLDVMTELVHEDCQKVVVFSQFSDMAEIILRELKELGINCLYMWGNTPKKKRPAMAERFNTDPKIDVIVGTDAMSEGLNLIGAHYVVNYDDRWVPFVMKQREDRCHRIKQEGCVTVINFVCRNTVEERVRAALYGRSTVTAEVLGDDDLGLGFVRKLSRKELLELL